MAIGAFDLLVLGTLVSVGGAAFIAKAYWRTPLSETVKRTPVAQANPVLIRHQIHQHLHALAGVRWLAVGAVALFLGVTRGEEAAYFFGPWADVLVHAAVLSLSWVATVARTRGMSRKAYFERMIELHRQGFDLYVEYLAHGGYRQAEIERGMPIQESARQRRLSEVSTGLDHIGRVIELPRRTAEGDHQYAQRLKPVFLKKHKR
jgi:hypothetical protein